jgi:hypothetical protein
LDIHPTNQLYSPSDFDIVSPLLPYSTGGFMKAKWLGAALVFAAMGGCDTTNNTFVTGTPDMAGATPPAPACTPNAKECVSSTLARVCPSDGSGWLAVQCQNGETCNAGDCGLDVNTVSCLPSDSFCVDDTNALICNNSGMGFHMSSCPAKTHCVNSGECAGSCIVGSGQCLDATTVLNCNDGFTLTPSPCPTGQACSDAAGGVCITSQCTPGACTAVCGNKTMDPGNNDPNFFSICQDTPFGWQWVAVGCTAPATCDPKAACAAQSLSDSCTTECTEGSVRCVDAASGTAPGTTAQQTCTNGVWGPTVVCDTTAGKVCVHNASFVDLGCGDTICGADDTNGYFHKDGYCVNDMGISKLRGCDKTGNLVPIDRLTACNPGTCVTDLNAPVDPVLMVQPGHCATECQSGDTRCDPNFLQDIQSCAANGLWTATTTVCTASCFDTTSTTGRPKAICGVCQPNDTRCTNAAGAVQGTSDFIETCSAAGQWASPAPCVASHCDNNPNAPPTKLCVAQCVPGKTMCLGINAGTAPTPSPIPAAFGTTKSGTCTADGRPDPSPTPCPLMTSCRTGPNRSNAYGCVLCASVNEAGMADTRCAPTGPDAVQVCTANNNGFTPQPACTGGTSCQPPQDPTTFSPETCSLTESDLIGFDPTFTCDNTFLDGAAIPCGGKPDCCPDFCTPATDVAPAVCF